MTPQEYIHGLQQLREQYLLPRSTLFPVTRGQLAVVEAELGRKLPAQYSDFLLQVGTGDEFLSHAHWYGVDPAGSAHILVVNEYLRKQAQTMARTRRNYEYPLALLAVFNAGHDHFGFFPLLPPERQYAEEMWCWNRRTGRSQRVAADFHGFLTWRWQNLHHQLATTGQL